MGEHDQLYGRVTSVIDSDTIGIKAQGRTTPVRLISADTLEMVDPEPLIECFGPQSSSYSPPGSPSAAALWRSSSG
jgi:endonuclease YncB( thermonuclease family)